MSLTDARDSAMVSARARRLSSQAFGSARFTPRHDEDEDDDDHEGPARPRAGLEDEPESSATTEVAPARASAETNSAVIVRGDVRARGREVAARGRREHGKRPRREPRKRDRERAGFDSVSICLPSGHAAPRARSSRGPRYPEHLFFPTTASAAGADPTSLFLSLSLLTFATARSPSPPRRAPSLRNLRSTAP